MPASVQVTYTSNYTDTEIGGGTEDIKCISIATTGGRFRGCSEAFLHLMEDAFKRVQKNCYLQLLVHYR